MHSAAGSSCLSQKSVASFHPNKWSYFMHYVMQLLYLKSDHFVFAFNFDMW